MVSRNPGYHEELRAAAGLLVDTVPRDGKRTVVDLGCGSGASTAALVAELDGRSGDATTVIGIDNSAGMLRAARAKPWRDGVRFVHGNAGDLRARRGEWQLPDELDAIFACYLVRNVPDADAVLADTYAALAPGGALVVHDYALDGSWRARAIWTLVCWLVVIPSSLVLTRRTRLYRYLWHSVLRFDTVTRLHDRLVEAGFVPVAVQSAGGWQRGVLHTVVAVKPAR